MLYSLEIRTPVISATQSSISLRSDEGLDFFPDCVEVVGSLELGLELSFGPLSEGRCEVFTNGGVELHLLLLVELSVHVLDRVELIDHLFEAGLGVIHS